MVWASKPAWASLALAAVEEPSDEEAAEWAEEHLTGAFHRTVLARYKCSLDLYEVREDDCGGTLSRRADVDDPDLPAGEPEYFRVRYGFRHLADGRICVVALVLDIEKLPQREQDAWAIEVLRGVSFATEDSTYERWRARNLVGKWNEAGPLEELRRHLHRIRAVTIVGLGTPLFEASDSSLLHYPIAENSAELLASVAELYRLVIDGLHEAPLRSLAETMSIDLEDRDRSLRILRSCYPSNWYPGFTRPLMIFVLHATSCIEFRHHGRSRWPHSMSSLESQGVSPPQPASCEPFWLRS